MKGYDGPARGVVMWVCVVDDEAWMDMESDRGKDTNTTSSL
jgi:hypothetical protein